MSVTHNLLALGTWSEDVQARRRGEELDRAIALPPCSCRPVVCASMFYRRRASIVDSTWIARRPPLLLPPLRRRLVSNRRRRRCSPLRGTQESRLTVIDLAVGHSGDKIARQPALARLASFQHSGRVTAVEVRTCCPWAADAAADARTLLSQYQHAPLPARTLERCLCCLLRADFLHCFTPHCCPPSSRSCEGCGGRLRRAGAAGCLLRRQRQQAAHAGPHAAGRPPRGHTGGVVLGLGRWPLVCGGGCQRPQPGIMWPGLGASRARRILLETT